MNRITITGRLTKDPEVRYSQDGKPIAKYVVAVDRFGKNDKADFFDCKAFDRNAEFVEKYLKKGTKILIEGSMTQGRYTTKDGKQIYYWELIADRHEFTESKEKAQPKEEPKDEFLDVDNIDSEELPFNF